MLCLLENKNHKLFTLFLLLSTKYYNFAETKVIVNHMRRILLPIFLIALLSAMSSVVLSGCTEEQKHSDTLDTTIIAPKKIMQDADSMQQVMSVTGEVVDGAKSQVTVKTEDGEFIDFSYEYLDHNDPEVFYRWSLDNNDHITVKYVEVSRNGIELDSVISIQKAD